MEVKIGVLHAPRELVVDVNASHEEVAAKVDAAVAGGTLHLTDSKGRVLLVPGDRIAYVELGNPSAGTVGFR